VLLLNTNAREQSNRLAIWKPLKAKGSEHRNRDGF
jgi:hypothetical protein